MGVRRRILSILCRRRRVHRTILEDAEVMTEVTTNLSQFQITVNGTADPGHEAAPRGSARVANILRENNVCFSFQRGA